MGRFSIDAPDEDTSSSTNVPTPPGVPRVVVRPEPAGRFGLSAPDEQQAKDPFAPGQFNKVFGELKPADVTPTQKTKWAAMTGLESMGVQPQFVRHLGNAIVDLPASLTPMGGILSLADFMYHAPRAVSGERKWANAGAAGLDLLGMVPGANSVRSLLHDTATFGARQAPGALTRETPRIVPAGEAPPWTRIDPNTGKAYPPANIAGTPFEQMGWVTPSNAELSGRGRAPFDPATGAPGMPLTRPPLTTPAAPVRGSAQQAYDRIAASPVSYAPEAATDIVQTLALPHIQSPMIGGQAAGFSPDKAPLVHNTLNRWEQAMLARGTPITAQDLDVLRSHLRGLPDANGPAGYHATTMLDAYQAYPPGHRIVTGTRADIAQLQHDFTQARGDYRGGETSRQVEGAIDRAGTRAGVTYSGGNLENATRQNVGALTTETGRQRIPGATDAEALALWQASQSDKLGNFERRWGKMLGGGGGMQAGQVIGGVATPLAGASIASQAYNGNLDPFNIGTSLALGLGAGLLTRQAGKAFNVAGAERTVNAAENAAAQVRRNTPLYRENLAAQEARGMGETTDPRFEAREAIARAMQVPSVRAAGTDWVDQAYVPYEYRDKEGVLPWNPGYSWSK